MLNLVFVVTVGLSIYISLGLGYMYGYHRGRRLRGSYVRRLIKDNLAIQKIVQEELTKEK